jgi:hypothetical protein
LLILDLFTVGLDLIDLTAAFFAFVLFFGGYRNATRDDANEIGSFQGFAGTTKAELPTVIQDRVSKLCLVAGILFGVHIYLIHGFVQQMEAVNYVSLFGDNWPYSLGMVSEVIPLTPTVAATYSHASLMGLYREMKRLKNSAAKDDGKKGNQKNNEDNNKEDGNTPKS